MEVQLTDHFGSDLMVANVARRSFGVEYKTFRTEAEGPRTPRGRSDERLIMDLAADGHWLPFRHPRAQFSCSAPIPIARQLGKHQVGMDWSEISRRYKTKGITFYRVGRRWRADVKDRRQGSGNLLLDPLQDCMQEVEDRAIAQSLENYEAALSYGAAPEQARLLLLQSMEAAWTWTGSLLAWAHLYNQRHHADAQQETREFAEAVGCHMARIFPYSWNALTIISPSSKG